MHVSRYALVAFLAFTAACSTTKDPTPVQPPTTPLTEHLTLGNPSGATADPNQPTN